VKAITVLEPEGSASAEIAAEIEKWSAKGIPHVAKFGGRTLKSNAVRFIAVLASPRNFIKSINHKDDQALIDASVFAVFISVVNLTISLPTYRIANVKADTLTYVLIDTVITLVFWFLYGSVYHLCARLMGGRGTYQSSLVAVLYLTAFTVISGIFSVPLSLTAISWSLESSDAPRLGEWQMLGNEILKSPTGLICTLMISATILYRWICTIGVFMIIHEVGRARGIAIGLFGASLSWFVLFTVEKPAIALFWRAFSS
jgi:hypothetical protein